MTQKSAQELKDELTRSEVIVLSTGISYSARQRKILVDRGLVDATSIGTKSLPRKRHENPKFELPLTDLGRQVCRLIIERSKGQNK